MTEDVRLRVGELTERGDFGRGIIRISAKDMKRIGITEGDIIELEGKRKTAAIAVRAYPVDIGLDIVRMDGLERRNCGAGIGESVKVKKAAVAEAKSVTIAPARKGIIIHMGGNLIKQNILMRPLLTGDIIIPNPIVQDRRSNSVFEQFFGMDFGEFLFTPFGEEKFVVVATEPKGIVRVTRATDVELLPQVTRPLEEERVPEVTYEDLGGLHEEVKKVREMIELPLKHPELFERLGIEPPKGILLHGPPGCGKTLLAKAVANESDATFLLINGPEVVSKFVGEAEKKIREKFEEAEKKAPSILFIDEIDAIASKREESYGEVEKRMVAQLLATMDGMQERGKVIVIAATNRPNSIDPALRRPGRFDREIEIGAPTKEGRLNILKIHTRNMPLVPPVKRNYLQKALEQVSEELKNNNKEPNEAEEIKETQRLLKELLKTLKNDQKQFDSLSNDAKTKLKPYLILGMLNEIAARTHGFVGADLASLCKEAALNVIRRVLPDINMKESQQVSKEVLEKLTISAEDFEEAMKNVAPSGMREVLVEIPNVSWEDVGGLETIKKELIEAVEWPLKYPDRFKQMGIRPPKGVLLYGPPGCGKTLLAKAVAYESEANFILVKGPELLNKWVGESEKGVREIFRKARQVAPTVIFFDEIDSIAVRRGQGGDSSVTERIVNTLLTELDGLEELKDVVVIAATNRPDILDPALLRPGRFDRVLLTPLPDEKARMEIFKMYTDGKNMPITKDVNFKVLVEKTVNYVGSDIEGVCREAAMLALRENIDAKEVAMKHFEGALDKVKGSIREQDMKKYREIEDTYIRTARGAQITSKVSYTG